MSFKFLRWVFHQRWLTRYRFIHDRLMKGFANLADQGHGDAQELYGFLLLHKGTDASSQSAGARYLMTCVNQDRPKVCWQLYQLFHKGGVLGFDQDVAKAQKYLLMAKQAEHPLAVLLDEDAQVD